MDTVSPADGAVALRSLPRRFAAILTGFDDDESPDDLVHRAGADGHSALDHAAHLTRSLGLIGGALHQALTQDRPVLHAGVVDDAEREWGPGYADGVDDVLALLRREADALADQAERVGAEDWTRPASIAGGGDVTAYDLLQEAIRTGVDHLKAAERTIAEVKRG
jgi:hypothetical protein